MKYVLVGGGYLATNLVRYLEKIVPKDSIDVIGIDEKKFFDITSQKTYLNFKANFEGATIFIFAAISSDTLVEKQPGLAVNTNIVGLANFLTFVMKDCNPRKVIFASSEWVYSDTSSNSLIGLGDSFSSYAQQKLCGEYIVDQFGRTYKVAVLIARFGIIWGRRKNGGACESIAKQCFEASKTNNPIIKVGNSKSARRFVHVDDLSFALSKIAGEPKGIYDITGSEIISIEEIVKVCGSILKKEFVLTEADTSFSRRVLQKSDIQTVSFTWQKVSFEDRMREHLNEYFL